MGEYALKTLYQYKELPDSTREYINLIGEIMDIRKRGDKPMACIHTYGCQQNVADSEKIKGYLHLAGFDFTDNAEDADFILFNTCAIREHAEDRVFGNIGALKHQKTKNENLIIGICGCMAQQEIIANPTMIFCHPI